jgi:LysR family transcriptional regulator, low CO2-responsive transcriptional regulator
MNYTLHQLQVFLKVTQTLSITKAAEALHLSQPAVSIQLKNFQSQFNIPLTEVIGRQLYVTEFGHEIAAAAEKIINEVYTINYKTLAYQGLLTGKLKMSVVSTGKYVMPYYLSDFLNRHPHIELMMDVTNKSRVVESLLKNEVDFALVSIVPENIALEQLVLLPNSYYLVGPKQLDLSQHPTSVKDLSRFPLLYREVGSGTRSAMEAFIEKNNVSVQKKIELTSNEAVKQALIAGLGYSIMPLIGLKNEITNGQLEIIPLKGLPLRSNWSLVHNKNKSLTSVAQAFRSFIESNNTTIRHKHFSWYETFISA